MDRNYKKVLRRIRKAQKNNLTSLDLSNLELTQLPSVILELTGLKKLDLSGNKLNSLPRAFEKLEELVDLELSDNEFQNFPQSIGKLSKLSQLGLSGLKLDQFPHELFQLKQLEKLDFSSNKLSVLPRAISTLTSLKHLNLSENKLSSIPAEIGSLSSLITLHLSFNNLAFIPDEIGILTKLETLALTKNAISSLPKALENLIDLMILALGDNELTSVPDVIQNFIRLEELYLWSNQLTSIPAFFSRLTNLKHLELSQNQLTQLPEDLIGLFRLELIDLRKNNFKVGPEVYQLSPREQIREILKWQEAQKAGTLEPIHEAKVIFIGESNYGKTHLIEFLREGKIKRKINTTHGIERSQLSIPHETKDIRLNVWDLGGQEFMRSTHQFFFSERTLYVLVTLARRERNELNHWLKLANQLGNKAPVLVVINKVDKDPHDLDRKSLQRDYPNIVGFVRTSIKNCKEGKSSETLARLKDEIAAAVSDQNLMPSVFEQRPPEWFAVKKGLEALEAKGTDFITYEEYENQDFIKDLPEEDRKSNLKLLSMIGAVVSFVDDPRLIDTNVINPQWIMDGVYAIINDPKVKDEKKGRLHIRDLTRILDKKKFPKARHAYLLELMEKFGLCYGAKDQRDIYFIPDLFEDVEPDFEWDGETSIHFRYNYDDFPPDAFMTKFIVEMHQDIEDDKRWRSGVFISNESCNAKVYQSYSKNFIHIEVTGNESEGRSYLYAIRETFRKLHKPFPQMKVRQEVLYKEHWLDYSRLIKLEEKNKPWYHDELDEDLPVVDILNGYSTQIDRRGAQKHIKIFLASSSELKAERDQFEIFIHRENKHFYKKGIYIELVIWEDFIDAMSKTRLQDEYNNAVKHSDIFVSLFFTRVGKFTLEEFETAFSQFKKTGRPLVYTYFKNANIKTGDITDSIQSLLDFQKKLKDLGHFKTDFEDIKDLQLQFKRQLEKVLDI